MYDPGQIGISRRSLLRLAAALPVAGGAALLQASEPEIRVPKFNDLTDQEEIEFGRVPRRSHVIKSAPECGDRACGP